MANAHVIFVFVIVYLSKQHQKLIMYPIDSFGTSLIFNIINSCFFLLQFLTCISMFFICSPSVFYQVHQIVFDFLQSLVRAFEGSLKKSSSLSSVMTSCFVTFPSCLGRPLGTAWLPRILYTLLALLVTCMVICQIFSVLWKTYFSWETRKTVMEYLDWNDGTLFPFVNWERCEGWLGKCICCFLKDCIICFWNSVKVLFKCFQRSFITIRVFFYSVCVELF